MTGLGAVVEGVFLELRDADAAVDERVDVLDERLPDVLASHASGYGNRCPRSESPANSGTAQASSTLPTADTHLPTEPSTTPDLDEALTKQGRAPLSPIHERRDPVRWLAALRRGVERAAPGALERNRLVFDRARRRNLCMGNVPFGKRRSPDGKRTMADPREVRVIAFAASLRRDGHTLEGIAATLNVTPGMQPRSAAAWVATTVHRVLVRQGCWQKGEAA